MASESAGVSGLAERYAAALFDLADERKALDEVASDLKALRGLIAESADLRRMIRSPVLARADQALSIFGGRGDVLRAAARFVAERKN